MPHRYLLGPLCTSFVTPSRDSDSCLTFGAAASDVVVKPGDSWDKVCQRLPSAWQPDAVVLSLGQASVPVGLWSAPLPLIALAPDGPWHWHGYRHVLTRCDLVVTDAETASRLRRLGIDQVHVPALWPFRLTASAPPDLAAPRDIDLLYCGDLHSARRRACLPWLGRLAGYCQRWRVTIQAASAEQDHEELLARARIVFHHGSDSASLRRLAAAAIAGALPFVPAGDPLPGPLWQDRHNCVGYTAENLETLLEHYLNHEDERLVLAEAARQQVLTHAHRFWPQLFERIERDWPTLCAHAAGRTPWDAPSELLARTWQALAGARPPDDSLHADLHTALAATPAPPTLGHALGLTVALGADAVAADHFRRVVQAYPHHLLARLNYAEALASAGKQTEAIEQARRTLALVDDSTELDLSLLDAGHYPPARDIFTAEWERAAWQHAGDPAGESQAKQTLLRWRLHGLLARLTGELVHRYEAALTRPDLPATRAALGSALWSGHRPAEAVSHLRQALRDNPFDVAAARLLYETLSTLGRHPERQQLVHQRCLLHHAAPSSVPAEEWFLHAPSSMRAGSPPRVSLCLIVRDEEANLPACLTAVADLVQEIIVVDTGSTDATRAVAQRFGARVYDFAWCDSFAAARNESLRHASGDWIFCLDADDRVDEDNRRQLRSLFASLGADNAAYLMRLHSLPDAVNGSVVVVDQAKLFRNDPAIRWQYRVHEQILPAVLRQGGMVRPTDIVITHTGYQDSALRRRKLERNWRLLLLDQAEHPNDPLTLFNLGALHLDLGHAAEAVPFLRRALDRAPAGYSLLPRLYGLLSWGLRQLGHKEEALAVCRQGRARYDDDGDLLFGEAQLLSDAGELAGAEACLRRLLSARPGAALGCLDMGVHGYKSRHLLAQLCRQQQRHAEAERLWREVTAERPDFVPGWLGLAELYVRAGREAELAAELTRREADADTRLAATMVRARLHVTHQHFAAARSLLEPAVRQWPQALWPRLLLGQTLVAEGRDPAAACRVLREVLVLDPHQDEARRQLARLEQETTASSVVFHTATTDA